MKTRNNLVLLIIAVFLILSANIANGQIQNRIIEPKAAGEHGVKINQTNSISGYILPNIDVQELLKEDSTEKSQGKPFRFGKATKVNVDFINAATKVINKDTTLMFYQITSRKAFSINLIFDKFLLASNASLLIYNEDRSMVYGPIEKGNNPENGIFWSDLVKGESIILQLTLIGEDTKETEIHIEKAIHGYRNTFVGFGQSADCNRDIACPEGNDWRIEGNSVGMILLADGTRFCSGSLLNNVCQNLEPNFLTAFHCLDLNQNGLLVDAERNQVNNWVFRFLYESPSCGGGDNVVFQSINGSAFRAAFQPTDFALLLLNNRPTGEVTYGGWSRVNVAATSAVAIHHPAGDVKKISIDDNPLTNVDVTTTWVVDAFGNPTVQCPPNTHWNTVFDSPAIGIDASTVQPGSSGSPIFNQNHQVVGQLHGDYLNTNNDYCENRRGQYGRFDVSWTGGGTNATRLSNWLDPNNTGAMTTNTINLPSISGPDLLCSPGTYTLQNLPAGSTATWSVIPASQFVNGSGTGTSAFMELSGNYTGIRAPRIVFTISTDCGDIQVDKTFWIGPPQLTYHPPGIDPCTANPYYSTISLPGFTYNWSVDNPNVWLTSNGQSITSVLSYNPEYFNITLEISDGNCTTSRTISSYTDGYYCQCFSDPACGNELALKVYPNPAAEMITVELDTANVSTIDRGIFEYELKLYTTSGEELLSQKVTSAKTLLDVRSLKNGFYYLHLIHKEGIIRKQIRIER